MFRRPNLYTSYEAENRIFPTWTQRVLVGLALIILFLMPFDLPVISQIPLVRFLGDSNWLRPMATMFIILVGALGFNLLAGVAGQVSLGHAFFMGAGAYTAAFLGGEGTDNVYGLGLPIWIWLPGAGIGAALVGTLIAPVAVKLRGLYLAIVTLGLVFIGIHMGNTSWGKKFAGDPGLGRSFPSFDIRLWKEEEPLVLMDDDSRWLWFDVSDSQKTYFFTLVVAIIGVVVAKNLVRSRTGRALQAIRDRDIAAEVMGVSEFRYKLIAFAISSFFAGISGAMFASLAGKLPAIEWDLFLSVEFIAIILIGGAGTVAGTVMGTVFVILLPLLIEETTIWLSEQIEADGFFSPIANLLLTEGADDFGPISIATQTPGWPLNIFDWNIAFYGLLIIVFLIFEPLGLYGIWVSIRNYWKGWPFSY